MRRASERASKQAKAVWLPVVPTFHRMITGLLAAAVAAEEVLSAAAPVPTENLVVVVLSTTLYLTW